MIIREWREADRGALTRLAKSAPDRDTGDAILAALHVPAEISAFDAHPTLVAVEGGNLIGIGTLWENDIHPARWRVSVFGRPTFWSQGAATCLLAGLRDLRPDQRALQTSTSARNEDISDFFEHHGFSLLMRTCLGVLPPGAIPESVAQDFDDAGERITEAGIRVVSLAEFRSKPFSYSQLARLHADIYEQGHTWDPVRELTGGEPAELFLDSDELLQDATYVALERKRLVGVSSLRGAGRTGTVELGWTGSVLVDEQQRKQLAHALLGASLRHAASENWRVSFEVDAADTIMWDMTAR
ncbi:MAG: hypothetical protein M3Z20_02070, partial [Chloroflexota bacterium]|nr:hypothetical protein [Chloroflexota bacterium]